MKKKEIVYAAFLCALIFGPFIAGPILFTYHHILAGILVFVIPYACLALLAFLRKRKQRAERFKIPNAHLRFTVIPVAEGQLLKELYENSALTFFGEPSDKMLDELYNWLNNEGVLKEESLNLYTYDGKMAKDVFGKRKRFGDEEKFMSIFLKDLKLNDSNMRQFSLDRLRIGGRWLDDIVGNAK